MTSYLTRLFVVVNFFVTREIKKFRVSFFKSTLIKSLKAIKTRAHLVIESAGVKLLSNNDFKVIKRIKKKKTI